MKITEVGLFKERADTSMISMEYPLKFETKTQHGSISKRKALHVAAADDHEKASGQNQSNLQCADYGGE